ncbi:unnamed protein product, partial [Prunus brigantina]
SSVQPSNPITSRRQPSAQQLEMQKNRWGLTEFPSLRSPSSGHQIGHVRYGTQFMLPSVNMLPSENMLPSDMMMSTDIQVAFGKNVAFGYIACLTACPTSSLVPGTRAVHDARFGMTYVPPNSAMLAARLSLCHRDLP